MLESKIESASVKEAKKHGWWGIKLLSTLFKGLPDRLFVGHGIVVFIEYKQPGKLPTKLQSKVHELFKQNGVIVHIAHSKSETMEILNSYTS